MKHKLYRNFCLKTFVKFLNTIFNNPFSCMTWKIDKGNGIVLLNANDYYNGVEKLFQDKLKFKQILEDPK